MTNCRSLCTAVRLVAVAGAVCALSATALAQQQPTKVPPGRDATGVQGRPDPKLAPVPGPTATKSAPLTKTQGNDHNAPRGVPPNDNCASAIVITGASGTVPTDNGAAGTDGIWPCAAGGSDIWFSWTAPVSAPVTFSFCPTEGGSAGYDTALQMTTSCGASPSVCNDDNCGLQSKITFGATSGTTYLIGVGGFASQTGTGTLGWALLDCSSGPPNNCCANATPIGDGVFPFSNVGANTDGPPTCGAIGSDIWYSYTPSITGIATVTTCSPNRQLDTVVAAYTGSCAALSNVGCNDDDPRAECSNPGVPFFGSTVSFCVTAGQHYLIQVGGFAAQQGTADLTTGVQPTCANTPPGAVPEGEPCDSTIPPNDTVNGGCNSVPPVFGSIACGGTVAGTAWADQNWRDTDWYQFSLAECSTVQITGSAQFPLQLFLLNGTCPPSILAAGAAPACGTASVTATVGAGTYAVFAGNQGFSGNPCGGCNNYWVSLACTSVGGGPPNDNCADATPVGPGTYAFDLQCSGNDYPGSCGASDGSPDVWFDYTATQTALAIVNACNQTTLDTVLLALDGGCGGSELTCNDDSCGLQSQIAFPISAGAHYMIRVAGFAGQVGAGTITITEAQPPSNDECAGAIDISGAGPFDYDNSVATTGSEGQGTPECNFYGLTGIDNDLWYRWTAGFTGDAEISFCNFSFNDTKVGIYTACPDSGGAVLACNDDSCGLQSEAIFPVTNGQTYIIQVGNYPGAAGGPGAFTINEHVPCAFTPAAGATPEGEACGSDTNGGCNSFPNIFTDVTCNGTWTGLAWAEGGTRDTDWYRFTLNTTTTVSATSETAFDGVLFIVSGFDPPGSCAPNVIANTTTSCGTSGTVSMTLSPGTYVFFVATGSFDGTPCGTDNGYNLTVDIGAAPCTPPCACDFNHDGLLNSQDFFDFLNCFFTAGCAAADFNHDGVANSQDFFDFLNCFFGGC